MKGSYADVYDSGSDGSERQTGNAVGKGQFPRSEDGMKRYRIGVVAGDGIGPEVTREARKVLDAVESLGVAGFDIQEYPYGADHYLETGETLPDQALEEFQGQDAVFMGAFGDPRIPDMRHAVDILLGTRFRLDLYVNHRPVKLLDQRLCPLEGVSGLDYTIFRENTEGLYAGMGGIFKKGTADEVAIQEDMNTRKGVERIIRYAFEFARKRGLERVCMSDKSNALRYGHDLWQRVFEEVGAEYEDIEKQHFYVDALVMQLVRKPHLFQVIVTCNMFGDIVTDLGAALQGGLGVAASANLHPGRAAMFEPVHGSAPKYAGKDVANPFAAILTAQMLLQHVGLTREGGLIGDAIAGAVQDGKTTRDLGGDLGTAACGDEIVRRVEALSAS